ncbi:MULTISPECIES: RNase adapter RapZ [Streptomyces]|uniref:RapZ C-terminal domain-containing protein n=1 Tax=Streptomyces TaxID=1883 RepID=UPI000241A736|nr:RNase adapter RapZ [Streptomyces sp. W007]EHM24782.1 hypothetical protein SPW_6818 [Streptomyces sp. W007]WTD23365.1 hypothetical protein OH737_02005 [Streptomyces anulatus]
MPSPALIRTVVASYGDGHHDAPRGDALRIDTRSLRNPPSDPAVRERMLHSTGLEPDMRAYVRATPGFEKVVGRGLERALGLLALPDRRFRVDVHVVWGGGRQRSVAVTEELAGRLRDADVGVETEHRHIGRPILSGVVGELLTDQELAALYLFARGRRQVEVAEALRVSPETVGRLLHGARVVLRARTLAVAPGQESGLLERPRGWTPARAGGIHRSSEVRELGSWAAGQLGSWARNRSPQGGVRPRRAAGARR